jgi:hypothetical protein
MKEVNRVWKQAPGYTPWSFCIAIRRFFVSVGYCIITFLDSSVH